MREGSKKVSVLLTGASGLLGQALIGRFRDRKVLGISRSGKNGTRVCDLTQETSTRRLFENHDFSLVIHTAAYSDVDGCERNPRLAHESNCLATRLLASECGRRFVPLVVVSTDYVFDGQKKTPYQASDLPCPVNIYGMTKLAGEFEATRLAPLLAIVRTSWLFGPSNPDNFVNKMLSRLKSETLVRVLDDQVDAPTYVEDLAIAIEKIGYRWLGLAKKKRAQFQEVFQVCNRGIATRLLMTLKMRDWLGLKGVRVERIDPNELKGRTALRPKRPVMSAKKYETFFHCRLRNWQESLKEYVLMNGPIK